MSYFSLDTKLTAITLLIPSLLILGCTTTEKLEVTATAYNSLPEQTHKKHYNVGAWGDSLKPGMKCIAVSRDLLELGLTHKTKVKIEGLPGTYRVLDKMNKKWTKTIDIYMGVDKVAAKEWGRQKVIISWKKE